MTPIELTATLHRLIPLTHAMAVEVTVLGAEELVLTAPLTANHNHAGSAFAGSLASLASIAGWAFLHQLAEREGLAAELLLADSRIRYRQPIYENLRAQLRVTAMEQQRFLASLKRGYKARLRLTIGLPDLERPAAQFEGLYVAVPTSPAVPTAALD
jgi:thioesterase domain-containing protein